MKRAAALVASLAASAGALAATSAAPCDHAAYRAFDFWLGRWQVTSGDEAVGESLIERSTESCAILEHYKQRDGYTGTSINFYDAQLRRWRQTWVDSRGNIGEYVAEAGENAMPFVGETHRFDGQKVLTKMWITLEADGTVRQHSDASLDGGASWKERYDFRYRKR